MISVLRKLIDKKAEEDYEEIVFEGSATDFEVNIKQKWNYPYWQDMENGSPLPKRLLETGSVPFEYNRVPAPSSTPLLESNQPRKILVSSEILKESPYLSHSSRHSANCPACNKLQYTTSTVYQFTMDSRDIEVSVPDHIYFGDLHKRLEDEQAEEANPPPQQSDPAKLDTWVFTAVSRGRCHKGNLNLRHSMVDLSSGNPATIPYVHVLVVSADEFEEYRKMWRSTHAIVKIPENLHNTDEGTHKTNAGQCRQFIQQLATKLGLDRIFLMDDNIPYVYSVSIASSFNRCNSFNCRFPTLVQKRLLQLPYSQYNKHLYHQEFVTGSRCKSAFLIVVCS